ARYAAEPVGNVLTPLAVVGGVWLWRRGQRNMVGLLLLPIALNGIAWSMSSYPMEASRVVVYAAPAVLFLIAAGIPPTLNWLSGWGRLAPVTVIVLVLVPAGLTALVLVKPWGRLDSRTPTAFVLERRLPTEPVVGTLWEQEYYCRHLGPYYRTLALQPTEPLSFPPAARLNHNGTESADSVDSLWILSSPNAEEREAQISMLNPSGPWRVVEQYPFRDVVVLRLRR
ncbi:MAG TPA: hypothetical protein VE988_21415, partial [Gemmataceae bacterium]|nr:hypothetical protein [Gemmataceae bacterium]